MQVNSDMLSFYYFNATLGCLEFDDPNACQLLANLCVVQMYNEDTKVCAALLEKMDSQVELANAQYQFNGYKAYVPWIYYKETYLSVFDMDRIKMRVSFDNQAPEYQLYNKLQYYLAKYELDGTFLGFEPLNRQLLLCEVSNADLERISRYGTTIRNSCKFDLGRLVSGNPYDLPSTANYFYELFLEDSDGTLIDVPVAIRNYASEGNPNSGSDEDLWQLTRRFMLFDTLSGIRETNENIGFKNQVTPEVIRYPKSITLRVTLDNSGSTGKEETIYSPLL